MLPIATAVIRQAEGPFVAEVMLDYDARLLRRKRLSAGSEDFLVDLPEVTSLEDGDAFQLSNGRRIMVRAASEPVLVIRGPLPRLAWHIGNRHTPCQIMDDQLVIRQDHVLQAMLEQLGADVTADDRPFHPEGGAYGHGRTFGHDHGGDHVGHDHGADHNHGAPGDGTHGDGGPSYPAQGGDGHDHGAHSHAGHDHASTARPPAAPQGHDHGDKANATPLDRPRQDSDATAPGHDHGARPNTADHI